jgi:hypothetical protein
MTMASAPPAAAPKPAAVSRSIFTQGSSLVSMRREDRASIRVRVGGSVKAPASLDQTIRAARSLAMTAK